MLPDLDILEDWTAIRKVCTHLRFIQSPFTCSAIKLAHLLIKLEVMFSLAFHLFFSVPLYSCWGFVSVMWQKQTAFVWESILIVWLLIRSQMLGNPLRALYFQAVATLGPHRGKAEYDSSAFPFRTDRNRSILNCWGLHTDLTPQMTLLCIWKRTVFPQSTALFSQGQHQLVSCYTHKNSRFASFKRANIIFYSVCAGCYQAVSLCSIFWYKIHFGDVHKLCFFNRLWL